MSGSPALDNVLVMSAAALAVRLFLGFVPRLRLPGPVLEILAGVVIGPQWSSTRDLESGGLPLLVAATTIGTSTGQMTASTATALVVAGLVASVAYPTIALLLLRRVDPRATPDEPAIVERDPEEM